MKFDEFKDWLRTAEREPLIMAVLNVTPDSFSDGGANVIGPVLTEHRPNWSFDGADLVDIGGESTRPGSEPVAAAEQVRRVVPAVREVARRWPGVTISVDTTRRSVAEAALDAGAHVINDISGGRDDPGMLPLAAERRAPVVLMHMQGTPATMQQNPTYGDVTAEVIAFLKQRVTAAVSAGVDPADVLVDPGIGFGKTLQHNLELLRRLGELCAAVEKPVVLGTSRKGFIGRITGEPEPARRQFGTAATVAWGVANGAAVLRVHDVGPMSQVARMVRAIQTGRTPPEPGVRPSPVP
jgi:dihydropteroate synthase